MLNLEASSVHAFPYEEALKRKQCSEFPGLVKWVDTCVVTFSVFHSMDRFLVLYI